MRFLLTIGLVGLFAYLLGGAIDHEFQGRAVAAYTAPGNHEGRYQGKTAHWWARRAVQARKDANARARTIQRLRNELANQEIGPTLAIRLVFGHHANAALRVAWCESRWHTGAQNGQYLGLFQMGSYARSRYGHSSTALGQAQAAYRYFADSGYDWSPWACKP